MKTLYGLLAALFVWGSTGTHTNGVAREPQKVFILGDTINTAGVSQQDIKFALDWCSDLSTPTFITYPAN